MSSFGKQRLSDFYIEPKYINLNHGSYGYCPKSVIQYRRSIQEEAESNTDKWFRRESQIKIDQTRAFIAGKIHCPTKNVFIIQNATDGINSIAKSMKWTSDDVVLLPSTAYACVRKTITVIKERYGVTIADIPLTQQDLQSPESIQLKVQDFVNSYPKKIKMVVIDHISSVPAIVFPVQTLTEFFREKGILCIVDGAHAIGNIQINISEIQPNAYFSNFHKWSFCPKNASFLYLDDQLRQTVRPALTGNNYGDGPDTEFYWTGTRDFSSYLTIKKGIEYHESFGPNAVMQYNHSLVREGGKRMAEIWGTRLLASDPRLSSSMTNVLAPSIDVALCNKLALNMLYEANCFMPFFSFDGKVYCRISAQIYNELSDYEFTANKFKEYLAKAQANESQNS